MIHLRRFNESRESDLDELKDFCEGSLAYLLDDQIDIHYRYHSSHNYVSHVAGARLNHTKHIYDVIILSSRYKDIEWDVIKDYFIPFLDRLSSRYKIHGWDEDIDYLKISYRKLSGLSSKTVNYYDVVNDRIDMDRFWSLHLKVEV